MSSNVLWDSIELPTLDIPYNRIEGELQDDPRFVRGKNTYVTFGGKVCRRPGTVALPTPTFNGYRVDRMWSYETLDAPSIVYIVVSALNMSTGFWEVWYQRQIATPVAFQTAGTYRALNQSTAPHEACVQRGLLFIKGYPGSSSSEKLGTVVFDGTGGTVVIKPWGSLGPTTPATLSSSAVGTITTSGGINASASSVVVNISAGTLPSAPFVIQIDFEQIQVGSASGTSGSVTLSSLTRAYNGTVAATHQQNAIVIYRGWSASAHVFTVNQGWQYSYAWKEISGQYTNRAPLQTNPDALPSNTLPFFNQIPVITVQGTADTTNFPSIGIFRTTDGGGTYYWLTDVTNTGAGNITFTDNLLVSAAGNADPQPDTVLDAGDVGPSPTDHSPPPTVLSPLVTGVATPALSSPIASYQGRLWFGIGNVLFFSAQEEIEMGVPEESWPSGLNGDFFRFQYPITNVAATTNYLYVFTLKATYVISGTNLQTFAAQPILTNVGFPYGMARAIDVFNDSVVFLSHDYRIIILSDSQPSSPIILSDVLSTDIVDAINAGSVFDIKYFGDLDKELIVVTGHSQASPSNSEQWVYDIKKSLKMTMQGGVFGVKKHFWNLPWTYPSTAMMSGRISETSAQRRLVFFSFDGVSQGAFARIDPTLQTSQDYTYAGTDNYDIDMVFSLSRVPAGDHVNQRRQAKVTPVVYSISFERTAFAGDDDPSFYWFADDLWTDPISVNVSEDPARRPPSKGYKTMEFPIFNVAQRIGWELTKLQSGDRFELQNMIITFAPDQGA